MTSPFPRVLAAAVAGTAAGALLMAVLLDERCTLGGRLPLLGLLLPLAPLLVSRRPSALLLAAAGVAVLVLALDPFGTYDCYFAG